jgi:hypothetical protein
MSAAQVLDNFCSRRWCVSPWAWYDPSPQIHFISAAFEVITAVVMKCSISLGYNTMQCADSQPTFRRKISSYSWWKNKPRKKSTQAQSACRAVYLLGLLSHPEDGGHVLPKRRLVFTDYTALYRTLYFISFISKTNLQVRILIMMGTKRTE